MDGVTAIDLVARGFGFVGVVVTVYAGALAALRLALRELGSSRQHYREIRLQFVNRILFGLDFFIVSDLILTFTDPGLDELIRLGAIVGIRILLAYFLEKEVVQFPDPG
jgi:uncharacterized membrane protein